MNNVMLLTRLQLMQTFGGFRASVEKKTGMSNQVSSVITAVLALLLLGATGYLGYLGYQVFGIFNTDGQVFNILFLLVGMLTFAFSLPTVLSTFFGDSDVSDLLTLPVSQFSVTFSKALGALSMAYLWTGAFIVGPMAGWGIASGAGPVYWLTYVAAVLCAPMLPVAYAGTLSILIATFFKRIRRKDTITTVATVVALGISVAIFIVYEGLKSTALGDAVNSLSQTMGGILMAFPSYGFAVYALRAGDMLSVLNFILVSVGAFVVFVFVARKLYIRVVTSLSAGGGASKAYEGSASESTSPIFALVRTDLMRVLRTSALTLNYIAYPLIVTPLIFGFSLTNSSLGELLEKMTELPQFGALFILFGTPLLGLFVLLDVSSNQMAATAVSREGSNWMYMKYIPIPLRDQLLAKAVAAYLPSVVITIAVMAIPGYLLISHGFDVLLYLLVLVYLLIGSWLMTCMSILSDCRRPRVEWGDDGDVTTKSVKGYGGLFRSMLLGILIIGMPSGLIALFNYVLKIAFFAENPAVYMLAMVILAAGITFVLSNAFLSSAARKLQEFE